MEWAQSQTGRMEYHPETLRIVEVIDESVKLYSPIASKKGIKIDTLIPYDVSLFVDNAMIHTVFRNIISNAIKFTNPGGLITISTCSCENYITVSVKDTGIGIPKNNLEKIFLIDSKHSTLGTEKEKGTGLGLILCKEFVEKNLGKIWAESIEGVGSTIYFTLPMKTN
jgi:signal transduction histidine kinase